MRVAHRYGGDLERALADLDRHVNRRVARQERGDNGGVENGRAHVDADAFHPPAVDLEIEGEDAASCLDRQLLFRGNTMVEKVLGDAANAVAAHFAFRAVGVEHSHFRVGAFGRHDHDEAVAADARMAVAHGEGERDGVTRWALVEGADIHVIVADSVHLGEAHCAI